MYNSLSEIKTIQIDHSSRCNLGCPQCARTDNGKTNPNLPITDLTLEDYKIILEPFVPGQVSLFHCGNYGDALASPTFDETFNYSLTKTRKIRISTNGSLRSPSWWEDLAKRGGEKLEVIFSLDGLEDTNHLYRIGASWSKIVENAQSFIRSGGFAEWHFIEFEHNFHQIDLARKTAQEMGFKKFNVKYTARFAERSISSVKTKINSHVIKDRQSNPNQKDMQEIKNKYHSFKEYVYKTPITCKFLKEKKLYIDMKMSLWPCCWFGAPPYFPRQTDQTIDFDYLFNMYGNNFNNLREYGWEVLQHDFFLNYLKKSWDNPGEKYRRIYTCGRTCGKSFEFSSGHGKNTKKEILVKS